MEWIVTAQPIIFKKYMHIYCLSNTRKIIAFQTGTFTSKFACAFPTHQTLSGDTVQQKDEVII